MPLSLYDATIPSFVQTLTAVRGLVDKAEAFCASTGLSETDLLNTKLADDMLPLPWQLKWVSTHRVGAIESVRKGSFVPDRSPGLESFAEYRGQIDASLASLKAVTPEEFDSLIGRDIRFSIPKTEFAMYFTAENFLLSFSLPNFYFHATTAYDILRFKGLKIGKRDYLGTPRIKPVA
jgi:uncharacterized protein